MKQPVHLWDGPHHPDDLVTCAYCGVSLLASTAAEVPAVDDDAAWDQAETAHAPLCPWVLTRAHRMEAAR